ncbi:MAG: RidA family protein [Candidatus Schekmanbacteria bacterium]|nr:RidA family protein [Candidatus Schekmanbacteria bacterium]
MRKEAICTTAAPEAIGPYTQAIKFGSLIFVSGQLGIDPATREVVDGGLPAQTRQVLKNLQAVLGAAGASFEDVVKTTIFLTDMRQFATVNEIYAAHFPEPTPARATVEVANLPRGAEIEIELIAVLGER